ncbi:glycolipid transfer protein B [Favolaschia claudopus]|uniref:Glycolipid transfer protein B n=1 Tax=Favolaschia claudopus TaxID=2862362 RepID=A0AAW0DP41_9AGAR
MTTPAQPYFETVKSFADVPITADGVDTEQFLSACDGLVALFDLLGSAIFGFVQADIRTNIAGVRQQFNASPTHSTTLESLVLHERSQPGSRHKGSKCLILLTRGLAFTHNALHATHADPALPLQTCFRRAYDVVLKQHHTFVVRSVVTVALHPTPTRAQFFTQISQGADTDSNNSAKFNTALTNWLVGLNTVVQRTKGFLEEGEYGRV